MDAAMGPDGGAVGLWGTRCWMCRSARGTYGERVAQVGHGRHDGHPVAEAVGVFGEAGGVLVDVARLAGLESGGDLFDELDQLLVFSRRGRCEFDVVHDLSLLVAYCIARMCPDFGELRTLAAPTFPRCAGRSAVYRDVRSLGTVATSPPTRRCRGRPPCR